MNVLMVGVVCLFLTVAAECLLVPAVLFCHGLFSFGSSRIRRAAVVSQLTNRSICMLPNFVFGLDSLFFERV